MKSKKSYEAQIRTKQGMKSKDHINGYKCGKKRQGSSECIKFIAT